MNFGADDRRNSVPDIVQQSYKNFCLVNLHKKFQKEVELTDPSYILKSAVIEISNDNKDTATTGVPDSPSRKQPHKHLHNQNSEAPDTLRKRGKAAVPASSSSIKSENSITQSSSTIPSRLLPMKGDPFGHHTSKGEKFTSIREISRTKCWATIYTAVVYACPD
ncbi:hypothetical protein ACMFMG_002680 [Clarireedia jacksonii]